MCPSGGQQVCWQGFGGSVLMAEGLAGCWCMLCMQLGSTGSARLPQASTCLKAGRWSGVFRATSHSPVHLQEDSVWRAGVCSQLSALLFTQPWESGSGLGGARVTPPRLFPDPSP